MTERHGTRTPAPGPATKPATGPTRAAHRPAEPLETEALWRTYRDQLLRFVRRQVTDEATAEDLLQEVFLRMHRNLHHLRNRGQPRAWLYRIARSVIVDHYRSRRPLEPLPEALAAPEPDRADQALRELSECLKPLIERLPAPYREAVYLSEIEGLTQQQLAERQGISLSGAKSRVQRGRARLRDMLTDCCRIEQDHAGRIGDYTPRTRDCRGC